MVASLVWACQEEEPRVVWWRVRDPVEESSVILAETLLVQRTAANTATISRAASLNSADCKCEGELNQDEQNHPDDLWIHEEWYKFILLNHWV